jgi:hypothetical protein
LKSRNKDTRVSRERLRLAIGMGVWIASVRLNEWGAAKPIAWVCRYLYQDREP